MHRRVLSHVPLLPLMAFVWMTPALAQPPHPPREPPPEALQACASKSRGEACTVTLPDRELQGTCDAPPDRALACRPAHPPGPPPEAREACAGKQAGEACTVTHRDRPLQGQCQSGPDDQLACRPEGPPPPPR